MDSMEFLETETGDNPVGCVIWMHGLGADATDFEPIVPMLPLEQNLRFVFPNAPIRPITVNGGMEMRGWYDIDPASPLASSDDIRQSVDAVNQLVEAEVAKGFRFDQITVAGFSQGGVIALELGLGHSDRLRGIMALSTYVNDHEHLAERVGFANVDTPIFMAHGVSRCGHPHHSRHHLPTSANGSVLSGAVAGIRHGPSSLPPTNHPHRSMAELHIQSVAVADLTALRPTDLGWLTASWATLNRLCKIMRLRKRKPQAWL